MLFSFTAHNLWKVTFQNKSTNSDEVWGLYFKSFGKRDTYCPYFVMRKLVSLNRSINRATPIHFSLCKLSRHGFWWWLKSCFWHILLSAKILLKIFSKIEYALLNHTEAFLWTFISLWRDCTEILFVRVYFVSIAKRSVLRFKKEEILPRCLVHFTL